MSRWEVTFIFGTSANGCSSLTTLLQFLDKSTLSYAGIFGILEDLVCVKTLICSPSFVFLGIKYGHYNQTLSGEECSWLASIFYFGQN